MPLKALHPLLEDGCVGDERREAWRKVSFIGISNWALDPAKMNRGIMVSRGVPTVDDLIKSADGICSNDEDTKLLMASIFRDFAKGYYHVYRTQKREFFGLRDFYALIKMLFTHVLKTKEVPSPEDQIRTVQRNFGGYFGDLKPAFEFLKTMFPETTEKDLIPSMELILDALKTPENPTETRYILLLTKNNTALKILQEHILQGQDYQIIFGSSFPLDQEYSQICLNINRIKIAMELGHLVVLSK